MEEVFIPSINDKPIRITNTDYPLYYDSRKNFYASGTWIEAAYDRNGWWNPIDVKYFSGVNCVSSDVFQTIYHITKVKNHSNTWTTAGNDGRKSIGFIPGISVNVDCNINVHPYIVGNAGSTGYCGYYMTSGSIANTGSNVVITNTSNITGATSAAFNINFDFNFNGKIPSPNTTVGSNQVFSLFTYTDSTSLKMGWSNSTFSISGKLNG